MVYKFKVPFTFAIIIIFIISKTSINTSGTFTFSIYFPLDFAIYPIPYLIASTNSLLFCTYSIA